MDRQFALAAPSSGVLGILSTQAYQGWQNRDAGVPVPLPGFVVPAARKAAARLLAEESAVDWGELPEWVDLNSLLAGIAIGLSAGVVLDFLVYSRARLTRSVRLWLFGGPAAPEEVRRIEQLRLLYRDA